MPNTTPSIHFINLVKQLKSSCCSIRIAEIGVDLGATTKVLLPLLDSADIYDMYDVSDCPLFREINSIVHSCEINIFSNSRLTYDSYAWTLAKLFRELVSIGQYQIYDAVYLDGAHTFPVDAPAACVIKEMLKVGGVILLDDMDWSLATSPTCNTASMRQRFTEEQMVTPHVRLISEVIFETDSRFKRENINTNHRAMYSKICD